MPLSLSVSTVPFFSFVSYFYHIFSVSLIFSLGNMNSYYWYCLTQGSFWCHPHHSLEPRLQAPCGGEWLISCTHRENTPQAQCAFSLRRSHKPTMRLSQRFEGTHTHTNRRHEHGHPHMQRLHTETHKQDREMSIPHISISLFCNKEINAIHH